MSELNKDREKVRWACRRGMLELDLFLVPFFEQNYDQLTLEEKAVFIDFLREPDPDLFAYLMAHKSPPQEFHTIVQKIRAFKTKPYSDRFV